VTVDELRSLVRAIVREHPAWTKAQVMDEVLRRAQPALPGLLDDRAANEPPYGDRSATEPA
jgi:hypothetical protein